MGSRLDEARFNLQATMRTGLMERVQVIGSLALLPNRAGPSLWNDLQEPLLKTAFRTSLPRWENRGKGCSLSKPGIFTCEVGISQPGGQNETTHGKC